MRFLDRSRVATFGALNALAALLGCYPGQEAPSSEPAATTASGDAGQAASACTAGSVLTYENFGGPFLSRYCTGCHGSAIAEPDRQGAPVSLSFDSAESARKHRGALQAAVRSKTMPPTGGPSDKERTAFDAWLLCGAPGFGPEPIDASTAAVWTPPTGACAAKRAPLPAQVMPRCADATRLCMNACAGDQSCENTCIAQDTTPPVAGVGCNECLQNQLLACAETGGCHDAIADVLCCGERECPPGSAGGCFQTKCANAFTGFIYCVAYAAPECLDRNVGDVRACFAPPRDAGAD